MNPIFKFYRQTIENVFTHLNRYAQPGGIVFLGDSITDFFRVNEFFPGAYVINRGISGDTTDGVLNRLPESVYELMPSKLFLMIGTNDLGQKRPERMIVENVEKIIDRIMKHCPDTRLFLESLYPVSLASEKKIKKIIVGKRSNEKICRINEAIQALAQEKGITYIDVYSHLEDGTGNLCTAYTVEGLHLTVQGYKVVADVLKSYVFGEL